jgi:hypothetical protein
MGKASGDPGAFSMLDARQERIIQGRLYYLEALLARRPRPAGRAGAYCSPRGRQGADVAPNSPRS